MKKLSSTKKMVLSIFPTIGFLFFLSSFFLLSIPYELYVQMWWGLLILMLFQLIFLIRRVILLKVETDKRILAILLILMGPTHLYYIWWFDDILTEK